MSDRRKRPKIVESFRLPITDDIQEFHKWAERVGFDNYTSERDGIMHIQTTLHGNMEAKSGDWIIKDSLGEFYPLKNEEYFAFFNHPFDIEDHVANLDYAIRQLIEHDVFKEDSVLRMLERTNKTFVLRDEELSEMITSKIIADANT